MRSKKGISAIVATLIIILLAIVAFGIVSVVVKNTVTKGAENIELSSKCLEIEMHATKIANITRGGGLYDITVSRGASGETLDGVKIILTDEAGETSYPVNNDRKQEIGPLEKPKLEGLTFANAQFTSGDIVSVTVVPFFERDSGKTYYCTNSWTDELTVQ